jgi:hypothetical protein
VFRWPLLQVIPDGLLDPLDHCGFRPDPDVPLAPPDPALPRSGCSVLSCTALSPATWALAVHRGSLFTLAPAGIWLYSVVARVCLLFSILPASHQSVMVSPDCVLSVGSGLLPARLQHNKTRAAAHDGVAGVARRARKAL